MGTKFPLLNHLAERCELCTAARDPGKLIRSLVVARGLLPTSHSRDKSVIAGAVSLTREAVNVVPVAREWHR